MTTDTKEMWVRAILILCAYIVGRRQERRHTRQARLFFAKRPRQGTERDIRAAVMETLDENVPAVIRYEVKVETDAPGSLVVAVMLRGRDWWKFWRRT